MTSVVTNNAAMSALRVLTGTQKDLAAAEHQISSGLRVAEASDNAAYWSISVHMRSQESSLGAVQAGLDLMGSITGVMTTALKSIISTVQSIQQDVVSAAQPGADLKALQDSIAAKQASIRAVVSAATFNGVNWLKQNDHYVVNESVTQTGSEAVTKADYDARNVGDTWNTTRDLSDTFTVTDPFGNVSNYSYVQPTETWISTVNPTSIGASSLARAPPTITQAARSILTSGMPMPFGVNQNGTLFDSVVVGQFTILADVDVTRSSSSVTAFSDQTISSSSSSGLLGIVGTNTLWSDETNPGQQFLTSVLPATPLAGLLSLDVTNLGATSAQNQTTAGNALQALVTIAARVGSLQTQISIQKTYNAALSDALYSGIGALVDADMNLASTRLQALQTKQQLGLQSLAIANDNSTLIRKLFGT